MKKNALFPDIAAQPSFTADAVLHGGNSNAKRNVKSKIVA